MGVGERGVEGGMARGWKPKGELGGGYFDNQLVMTGAWEESSQLLAGRQAWGPGVDRHSG